MGWEFYTDCTLMLWFTYLIKVCLLYVVACYRGWGWSHVTCWNHMEQASESFLTNVQLCFDLIEIFGRVLFIMYIVTACIVGTWVKSQLLIGWNDILRGVSKFYTLSVCLSVSLYFLSPPPPSLYVCVCVCVYILFMYGWSFVGSSVSALMKTWPSKWMTSRERNPNPTLP
jgi:hypothetical protein